MFWETQVFFPCSKAKYTEEYRLSSGLLYFDGINVSLHVKPLAWCPGQVKIMKEFVWINIIVFLNLAFRQVGEKKLAWRLNLTFLTQLLGNIG
jgi:hypothetical protein